jgi:hypothetical protein
MKKLNKKVVHKVVILSGYLFALGQFFLLYFVFLVAYFNPGKMTFITVNTMGEADIEFILIPITLVVSLIGMYLFILNMRRDIHG